MPLNGPLPRLADIAPKYDGILSDVWGVVHDGLTPHAGAVAALSGFRATGGHVVLVTNAARPGHVIVEMLDGMGVPRDAYDAVISSGDVTREFIAAYAGRKIHHVGPLTDDPIFEGIDITRAAPTEAEAVVVTGLDRPRQTPADYETRMTEWLDRGLPLICANPDKVVEIGGVLQYCPGALADIYAERGGRVEIAGKPYQPIYDAALQALEKAANRPVRRSRVLAIGDSVRTDATGAAAAGLDFLFVTGSVHAAELGAFDNPAPQTVIDLVAPTGVRLAGYQPRLA